MCLDEVQSSWQEAWADEVDVLEKQIGLHLLSFQTTANAEAIAAKVDEDDAEAREAQDAFEQGTWRVGSN